MGAPFCDPINLSFAMPKTLPRRAFAVLASVVVAAAALFALYMWIVLHWSYSEGERAGYLQKLSRKASCRKNSRTPAKTSAPVWKASRWLRRSLYC